MNRQYQYKVSLKIIISC